MSRYLNSLRKDVPITKTIIIKNKKKKNIKTPENFAQNSSPKKVKFKL